MERYPDWRVEELANKYAPADAYWPDDVDEDELERGDEPQEEDDGDE